MDRVIPLERKLLSGQHTENASGQFQTASSSISGPFSRVIRPRGQSINQSNVLVSFQRQSKIQATDCPLTDQSTNQLTARPLTPPQIGQLFLDDEAFPALSSVSAKPLGKSCSQFTAMNLQGRPKSPVKFRDGGGISRAGKSQTVDFSTLLTPAKKAPVVAGKKLEEPSTAGKKSSLQNPNLKGNALDSSIPTKLRGKEKALPKPKKPSALRRAILQSRQSEGATLKAADSSSPSPAWIDPPDSSSVHSSETLQASCEEFPARGSATSPLSPEMETTCDPLSKTSSTLRKVPDRAFYCQHLITTEVSTLAGDILDKLVFYQDRAYHQDPALYKRRFVCGFKDVVKHIDTKEIRLIFLASDLERVDEPGGITDQLEKIRRKAEEFHVPVVFVGKRRMLARKCRKPHVVSVVGIYNYDVAGTEVKRLLALGQEEEGKQTGRQTDSQADR